MKAIMADIIYQFSILAASSSVFDAVSTPRGLDSWWTVGSSGRPVDGEEYLLNFGPSYDWRAIVTRTIPNREFELEMTFADQDWTGTRVGFLLEENEGVTHVHFHHLGWPQANEHHRISSFCWAMYLRLLKRYVEYGELIEYDKRLDA